MRAASAAALAMLVLVAFACAPSVNDPADVQAVRQLVDDYVTANNAGDAAAAVAAMSDSTVFAGPHLPALTGREAIASFHRTLFEQFATKLRASATDVQVTGALGSARGTWSRTLEPRAEGLATRTDSGDWAMAVRRQDAGGWVLDWLVVSSGQPAPGTTPDGADEKALVQIEQDWVGAAMKRDVATLDRILASEWTVTWDGQTSTKAQILSAYRTGAFRIESFTLRDLSAHVFGDTAIVTMTGDVKGTQGGTDISGGFRGTDFFVKREGRWQAVSTQNASVTR